MGSAIPAHLGFQHRNIRLPPERYLGRRLYFITIGFHGRRRFGTNPRVAHWIICQIREYAIARKFFVHAYCVMPDHVHILAAGMSENSNMLKFVATFEQDTAAVFGRRTRRRLWQFKYYDHILRGADSADRVAAYIWLNPVRKGLCADPREYPFLGSFTSIGLKILKDAALREWTPPWKMVASEPTLPG
ncbi:MAG TPA: transposase [Candidatus Acidoferrales bacterium]|nr:transposase [Candidatus Acidoferrales bacterium]